VVLDGTTLEEVEEVHKPVLLAAVRRANENERKYRAHQQKEAELKRQGTADFRQHVEEMADKIKFD
jgi:hypothetical protein